MKKMWIVILILVTGVICSAETPDCLSSKKIGIGDAVLHHSSWNWYFIGLATPLVAYGSMNLASDMAADHPGLYTAISVVSTSSSFWIYAPALLVPRKASIFPTEGVSVDLDCYRTGYARRAKLKNSGSLFLGQMTAAGIIFVIVYAQRTTN